MYCNNEDFSCDEVVKEWLIRELAMRELSPKILPGKEGRNDG